MGLVQRRIEAAGIATVSVSLAREITERLAPPRSVFVKWPLGHALGEPGAVLQQRRMIWECFRDLRERPPEAKGEVRDLGLRWKRETYEPVDFAGLDAGPTG